MGGGGVVAEPKATPAAVPALAGTPAAGFWSACLGRFGGTAEKRDRSHANVWQRITFGWASELVSDANKRPLEDDDAAYLSPEEDRAENISRNFDEAYIRMKAAGKWGPFNPTFRSLVAIHRPRLIANLLLILLEVGLRLVAPVVLRAFLLWLEDYNQGRDPDPWRGWLLAVALGACSFGMACLHHQIFWIGMHQGYIMRQQVIAAVYGKVLRLNSASIGNVSAGHVVNLVSNDVRRFDDAMPFWIFLVAGPLELGMVLLMVSLELGFLPALAGVAATLLLIPLQAALVRPVANIRQQTARRTDERVRLASEVIQGALAMKMLGWERPIAKAMDSIRSSEASWIMRMAAIRGVNNALQFAITPVVAFATFSVYRATKGVLDVPSVFYALSLLQLPRLFMVQFFIMAVQSFTELWVSIRRIDAFLSTEEPQQPAYSALPPSQQQQQQHLKQQTEQPQSASQPAAAAAATAPADDTPHVAQADTELTRGSVVLRGADYDWLRPLGHAVAAAATAHASAMDALSGLGPKNTAAAQQPQLPHQSLPALRPPPSGSRGPSSELPVLRGPTLSGVALTVRPGELLGIAGEVGSGKSSLLAALLGELLPLPMACGLDGGANGADGGRGPLLVGCVAYCSQIPWIASGTVRENITFGCAYEPGWYGRVVAACALQHDLDSLPAGDETELGERGINLSGGQKARVALARCVYCRPDIMLLDDPLSAVDPRVGRTLFDEALGPRGLANATTRLLVTHQRQFLPRCDRVLVLRAGRVLALGTWEQLLPMGLPELMGDVEPGATVDEVSSGAVELIEASGCKEAAAEGADDADGGHVDGQDGRKEGLQESDMPALRALEQDEEAALRQRTTQPALDNDAACDAQGRSTSGTSASVDARAAVDVQAALCNHPGVVVKDSALALASTNHTAGCGGSAGAAGSAKHAADATAAGDGDGDDDSVGSLPPAAHLRTLGRGSSLRALGSMRIASVLTSVKSFQWMAPAGGPLRAHDGSGGDGARGAETDVHAVSALEPHSGRSAFQPLARGRSYATGLARLVSLQRLDTPPAGKRGRGGGGADTAEDAREGQLVSAEGREVGTVSWHVYIDYAYHIGSAVSMLLLGLMVAGQAAYVASDWWLALWSRADPIDQLQMRWLWIYACLTGAVVVLSFARAGLFFWRTIVASTRVHHLMALRVLRAPLSFFHTSPTGRVLNRFSKDLAMVDDMLPLTTFDAFQTGFQVLAAFVMVAIAVPVVLPVFLPLAIAFYLLRARYVRTSREVKRFEAVTRSPVFASFSASIKGLPTIRAFAAQRRFRHAFLDALQRNGEWFHAFIGTARWVGFRLDLISATTLLAAGLLAMAVHKTVETYILALALTYTLQLTGLMQWFVRQTAEVENNMTALERLLEYTRLPQEPPDEAEGGGAPPGGWPRSGALEYADVTAVYRPGLPPVLSGVSFLLPGGSSCGLVGRTGSGKSSLMLTLFRLIDVTSGAIRLDGVDITRVGLDVLRRQLAIIPQDPVLFSGTVRSNLDPFRGHEDSRLWDVLSAVKLKGVISSGGGLDARMAEAGDNLSVGQRQLFCLARALLQDAHVLALDEATANVDRTTDALIQKALRDFAHADTAKGRVLLVIAHRIDTIMDCDNLLLLSSGRLIESGNPQELAESPKSQFGGMVRAARLAVKAHQ